MRYWIPRLLLGAIAPPQTRLQDKFGGWPWGLPPEQWPVCKSCGEPMTHLATLTHDTKRLDLGKEGRVLMVFQCGSDTCQTWDAHSGANAVLFLDADEQTNSVTEPQDVGAVGEIEARVSAWQLLDDAIPEDLYDSFFGSAHHNLPEEVRERVCVETKIGSVPAWVQGAEEGPKTPYRFVAQFGYLHRFSGPKPPHLSKLYPASDGTSYTCEAANYGDGGNAYLFIAPPPSANLKPSGLFFWQCG